MIKLHNGYIAICCRLPRFNTIPIAFLRGEWLGGTGPGWGDDDHRSRVVATGGPAGGGELVGLADGTVGESGEDVQLIVDHR